MSPPDLGDPRFDAIAHELRQTAPAAPAALRNRVEDIAQAATAQAESRRRFSPWRLVALGALVLTLAATAAVLHADKSSTPTANQRTNQGRALSDQGTRGAFTGPREPAERGSYSGAVDDGQRAAALAPSGRLQDYDARMTLRVRDADALDRATKSAIRTTRRLGGFVASIRYGTSGGTKGDARLVVRVPVGNVQSAIARFSTLGTIVSQNVSITDLQQTADRQQRSIAQLRRRIADLAAKQRRQRLTVDERIQLENSRRDLQTLTARRARLVRDAAYATVSLDLTTQKPAAKRQEPGRFGAFWDDASTILTTELVWLLYALVVAGPFLLLAALALVAERTRRRRSDDAVLAHH